MIRSSRATAAIYVSLLLLAACSAGDDTTLGPTGGARADASADTDARGALPGDDASPPGADGGSDASATPDAANAYGDEYGPWAGGSAYYARFTNGPPADPSFFPIGVWLQDPSLAAQYAAIGVNTYVGLWNTPTAADLSTIAQAGLHVLVDQSAATLGVANKTLDGWAQTDEPDNAQPDGKGGYGPCISAATIQSKYTAMQKSDTTRPIFLNLGQGVGNTGYVGRGSCSGIADYPDYCKGADIVSFDLYPVNDGLDLLDVPLGVDRLGQWVDHKKPVYNWIECTRIGQANGKPTPEQVKAEVWMSIVHGSMGIGYFVHQFTPTEDDHALLDDPAMKSAVSAINAQIRELAPALDTPPITNAVKVAVTGGGKVDALVKRRGGTLYVLAVSMGTTAGTASFTVQRGPASKVTVLGEGRTVPVTSGVFQDAFAGFAVHVYAVE